MHEDLETLPVVEEFLAEKLFEYQSDGLQVSPEYFFLHTQLAGFVPQPFSLDTTGAACAADVINVVRFDMLIELLAKFLYSLAVRHTGERLPATRLVVRITCKSPQFGDVFGQCFGKLRNRVLVV